MPRGADFVCKNEECKHCDSGFVMTDKWPLGEIEEIIESKNVKKNEDFCNKLTLMMEDGTEYSCINYPNIGDIITVGYRIQKFCKICSCIWAFEIMCDKEEDFEKALEERAIPEKCCTKDCDGELVDFEDLFEDGLDCLHCGQPMFKSSWFSTETNKES